MARNNELVLENAKFIFRPNFSGAESEFNHAGDRNFNVIVPNDIVEGLVADGWNVKTRPGRTPDEEPTNYIKVNVKFGGYPPEIVVWSGKNKTFLDENTAGAIDRMDIDSMDMIISPYHYDVRGKQGVSAYLSKLVVVQHLDPLEAKYANYGEEEPKFY